MLCHGVIMHDDGKDVSICDLKSGKIACNDVPVNVDKAKLPSMSLKVAWVLIMIAFVLVIIAAVLNHLMMSIPAPVFVFPFFGGIEIDRWTLYDISLFLFVAAPCLIAIAFIFAARNRSRIIMIRE
jgi:hypothetical protein